MYKLVVSGFDNVLINSDEAISTSTILEIDRVRNNEVLFAILCDRGYKEVLEYNKDFSFVDYIISCNGACGIACRAYYDVLCKLYNFIF